MLLRRLVLRKGVIEETRLVIEGLVACSAIQVARLPGILRLPKHLHEIRHMHPHKVNPNIPFLKKLLVASLARTLELRNLFHRIVRLHLLLVFCVHVEIQKILLKKLHIAMLARMGQITFMLLQMIIHGALILLDCLAMGADEMAVLVLHVLGHPPRSRAVCVQTRLQNFFPIFSTRR